MIYQALADLARRENLLEDTCYEPAPVHYLLALGSQGQLLEVLEPRDPPPLDKKGRPKGKPTPVRRPVPRRSDRTAGAQAEFLVDKAEYVFGIDPLGKRSPEKLAERRRLFLERVEEVQRQLPGSNGLQAVLTFLRRGTPDRVVALLTAEKESERHALAGALFAFVYEPDGGVACVHDEPAVKGYFRDALEASDGAVRGQCLVTGEPDVVLTRLHAKPRGIPPKGTTKGGVPLTSVNLSAFQSYGLGNVGGAPVSRSANVAVELALNRLLDPAYPDPRGGAYPPRCIQISSDTVVVYWSAQEAALDFVLGIEERDPEEVGSLLRSPFKTWTAPLDDPTDFFALVLSGSTGRGIVRSFLHSTVRDVAAAVDAYRLDSRIVRAFQPEPGGYPLAEIRRAMVPRADLDLLPPTLGTALYMDILNGRGFPRAILEAAVRRNHSGDLEPARLGPRCSLLKAYFNRNLKEEISVMLDSKRPDVPYRLGRLLATLDKVQQDALGSVNATLVDRYYGAASSTPAAVFPTLLRRLQNHLGKLRREKPGLAVNREKLVQEILEAFGSFPATMGLEAQGVFALGFYHQRQDLFT